MKSVLLEQYFYKLTLVITICLIASGCSAAKSQPSSGIKQSPILSKTEFIAEDTYRLPLTRFWPDTSPEGIIIALHGFNDYSKGFEGMCQYFLVKNWACISYDQRGFGGTESIGLWPEEGRLQKDLYLIVKEIRLQHPLQPIYLVGESMGGAVIMTTMADTRFSLSEQINGAILYAPAVWARSTQPWYQQFSLWLAVNTFPSWKPTSDGLGIQVTDNMDALREMGRDNKVIKATRIDTLYGLTNLMDNALLASKDVSVNTLVLYGDKDEVVPKKPTCQMLEAMSLVGKDVEFINYPEGYHMLSRDLQAEKVFYDSYQWIINGTAEEKNPRLITLKKNKPISYCAAYQ